MASVSAETTGSITVEAAAVDQVDPSDWEAVRRALAGVSQDAEVSRIEWSNPDTGSTGTIATLDLPVERSGTLCRPFATTVSDVRGVSRYRGEACRRADGRWQLFGVIADDAQFS
jgi:surface antigen